MSVSWDYGTFVLRKLILQTRMRSHPVELDVWFLVGPFVYFHTSCVRTAKALARLRGCAGSPEPSLVAYVISTIISWAGLNRFFLLDNVRFQWACTGMQRAHSASTQFSSIAIEMNLRNDQQICLSHWHLANRVKYVPVTFEIQFDRNRQKVDGEFVLRFNSNTDKIHITSS